MKFNGKTDNPVLMKIVLRKSFFYLIRSNKNENIFFSEKF